MMRYLVISFISFLSLPTYAIQWQDLWSTPDQQGQNLMTQSKFKEAKETFSRQDWAAAAAYRAGDYQKAAELYHDLKNEQGYYNEGNALAHKKQYEAAINAYDKALAINATNEDAIYNRKLVEELLKNNKEQQNKEQQDKEQQDKEQQDKEQQDKEQQDKEQHDKEQQDKEQQDKEQQDKEQQDKEQQDKEQQDKEQQNKEQQDKEQQDKEQQDKEQESKTQKEAEAEREKKQAKEQWLRLIPDDPGGLMKQKFLRDHLRRQNGWYQ
ncbi:tetratricopeptide repeat protein [Legionella sp.]|uniref:tetratricopeptide repeat protein n=1 Tax=Legionella sp. TaxID=459 RepID=UPI003C9CD4DD